MRMRCFLILTFFSLSLASWPQPIFLGYPPNMGDCGTQDAEFGLNINDCYFTLGYVIYFTQRTGATWSTPVEISVFNPSYMSTSPALTGDGTRMYFCSASLFNTNWEIYRSEKVGGVWQTAVKLPGPPNSVDNEWAVAVSPDESTLYFSSNRNGGGYDYDIFKCSWNGGSWSSPIKLSALCTEMDERVCDVSSDGTKLYFDRRRTLIYYPDTLGDLYVSTWGGTWSAPQPITDLNTTQYAEIGCTIAPGNNHLIFCTNRPTPNLESEKAWESIQGVGIQPLSLGGIKASFK
jgi:hypothetical protein